MYLIKLKIRGVNDTDKNKNT